MYDLIPYQARSQQDLATISSRSRRFIRILSLVWTATGLGACAPGPLPPHVSRLTIFGGQPTALGDLPFVAALGLRDPADQPPRLLCTAVLVAPDQLLTAAHCLDRSGTAPGPEIWAPQQLVVSLSGTDGTALRQPYLPVAAVAVDPNFRHHPLGYGDLGSIRLASPLTGPGAPAPVPVILDPLDLPAALGPGRVEIAGYGRREDGGTGQLRLATADIRDVGPTELLAGGSGHDACDGDSGGPGLTPGNRSLVAVISRGAQLGCGAGSQLALVAASTCWLTGAAAAATAASPWTLPYGDFCHQRPSSRPQSLKERCQQVVTPTAGSRAILDAGVRTTAAIMTALGIRSCDRIEEELATRRALSLDGFAISDLSPLTAMPELESLSLRGNRIDDISPLRGLPALTTLRLEGNLITETAVLAALESDHLHVYGRRRQLPTIADTAFLRACLAAGRGDGPPAATRTVEVLRGVLQARNCTDANLRLINARSLDLSGESLTDLSPLAGAEWLTALSLAGNPITNVADLAGLEDLKMLDLAGTAVHDLSALAPLMARGLLVRPTDAPPGPRLAQRALWSAGTFGPSRDDHASHP